MVLPTVHQVRCAPDAADHPREDHLLPREVGVNDRLVQDAIRRLKRLSLDRAAMERADPAILRNLLIEIDVCVKWINKGFNVKATELTPRSSQGTDEDATPH